MKSARRVLQFWVGVVVVAGCASTNVTQRDIRVTGKIPRPNRILVYDFGATSADVPPESTLAGQYSQQTPTADQLAAGRALGAEVARNLVADINEMGLSAVRATGETGPPQLNDIVIRGYFVSIDEGSAAKRMLVGFGSGAAELKTAVEGFQMTEQGLRRLGSGTVDSSGGKGPGAAVPAAVAIATANPIGLIVTSAVKVAGEASGSSTVEGRGKQTAQEIADVLRQRFEQQGWIH
ncbi:MAG TPA: DUF4410 domain-containing protein [Myxococcota bacterium]|nr:DUF4410 domain-containing protein [Myxococcota bacterium]